MKANIRVIAVLLTLALFPIFGYSLSLEESNRIDAYLTAYYTNVGVIKRTTNAAGEVITCVDRNRQPAFNNPSVSRDLQVEPSAKLKALLPGPVVPAPQSAICPSGSLEMRLPTRDKIVASGRLRNFMSKAGTGQGQLPPQPGWVAPNMTGHYYAGVGAYLDAIAAQTTINTWRPTLASPYDFSLTQLWMVGGSGSNTQTVEAGAQVYGAKYGNTNTNFFVYWTADNYFQTGCYNLDCSAFVQVSNILPIGGALPVSTYDGTQAGGPIVWYRDPDTGNWLLFLRNADDTFTLSGYYPASLFGTGQLSQYATRVDFGGEVYTTAQSPQVPMGSGYSPYTTSPLLGRVAFQRNLLWMDRSGTTRDYDNQWSYQEPTTTGCAYALSWYPSYSPYSYGWGASFFFGGPGYSGC